METPIAMTELLVDQLKTTIFPTRAEMGRAVAADAARAMQGVIERDGAARVILASAPSQNELLENLTRSEVDWSRVTIFHMDEYVGLDAEHPASFRRFQAEHVLARIRPKMFEGIRGEAPDVEAECRRYERLLAEAPIDVVCLGIGENGHLAFNDPPVADFADPRLVKPVALDEVCRQQQVNDGCFASLEAVPRRALTLTIPALMRGKELFATVPGPRKAWAVRETLRGPIAPQCPASILRQHPAARLYLDAESASML